MHYPGRPADTLTVDRARWGRVCSGNGEDSQDERSEGRGVTGSGGSNGTANPPCSQSKSMLSRLSTHLHINAAKLHLNEDLLAHMLAETQIE